jgi:glyoxylase-like metal-dependent hydrolase (beta-lactamase superfamily II)
MWHIESFVFSPIQENTYLLYTTDGQAVIIDPGCYFEEERAQLKARIEALQVTPVALWNTHTHLDHVFGNQFVFQTWGLGAYMHPKEDPVLDSAPAYGLMYNLPVETYTGPRHYLADRQVLTLGTDRMEVIHAPGHSPGSVCFYTADQGFLIGGDVLFQRSIGRTDLPGGHHATLIQSIQQRLMVLPDETVVYSGHGDPTTIGEERSENPFLNGLA